MNVLKQQDLLRELVTLIEHERTGTPAELAQRLGVTDRTVKRYIAQLRAMGADISFCSHLNSYHFASPVTFRFGFESVLHTEDTLIENRGG